jgi:predicted nucleic acid-binding protein
MLKQGRMSLDSAHKGHEIFEAILIRYTRPDFAHALTIAHQINMHAYDAYFLDCALRYKAPLLSLDRKLVAAARNLNIAVMEV